MSALLLSSLLLAQDGLKVAIDAAGKIRVADADADLAAVEKAFKDSDKEATVKLTTEAETPAAAVLRVLARAHASGVSKFEWTVKDKTAKFKILLKRSASKMIDELRVHICANDDWDAHLHEKAKHYTKCSSAKLSESAWLWIGGNCNTAEDISTKEKHLKKTADQAAKTIRLVEQRSQTTPPTVVECDPNVAARFLHAVVDALSGHGIETVEFSPPRD